MSVKITNLETNNRHIKQTMGNFSILEYEKDISVSKENAMIEYYMAQMNIRRRQLFVSLNGNQSVVVQAGAMQLSTGSVSATTGIKGVGDYLGKMAKSVVTKESVIKPEYVGNGYIFLEPTHKYIILQDVESWGPTGMAVEDGMFLACDGTVKQSIIARSTISSAVIGGEGLFNLCMLGKGIVALESNVPQEELIEVEVVNDSVKIDGNMAIAWTGGLKFTVERSGKTLIGSAASGEGLVNVYSGTGKVLISPVK